VPSGAPYVAVLLGAGASADAGIPTTVQMTEAVIERMDDPTHARILEFVRHTLAAALAQRRPDRWSWSEDVAVDVDVERLFASVELLIDRYEQPWSPFVAGWHPGLESFSAAPSLSQSDLGFALNDFERALKSLLQDPSRYRYEGFSSLRKALEKAIERGVQHGRPTDVRVLLTNARDQMLRSLFDVLHIEDAATVAYLTPLVELARTQGSLAIATLNYDRSIENAAELAGAECDTGIETWLTRGELEWPEDGLRLLKLHGSINWVVEDPGYVAGKLPSQTIRKVASADEKARYERPAVVFGEAGKLRSEGPYLELLLAWSADLKRADNLLVVGYSFRDHHVNEAIARWFNAVPSRRIILVDPSDLRSSGDRSFAGNLAYLNELGDGSSERFQHFAGTTSAFLEEAIKAATTQPMPSREASQAGGRGEPSA
jgi:hypothetical protein